LELRLKFHPNKSRTQTHEASDEYEKAFVASNRPARSSSYHLRIHTTVATIKESHLGSFDSRSIINIWRQGAETISGTRHLDL
jgi:hypothetical protein